MPSGRRKAGDLHGNVPDASPAVLMLVDVINDLDFPGNEDLVKHAALLGQTVATLKARCRKAGIPAIYVNDNRDKWRSDFRAVVSHCRRAESLGRPLVEALIPEPDDYIVLKPKHSAFYATPLDTILAYLMSTTAEHVYERDCCAWLLRVAGDVGFSEIQAEFDSHDGKVNSLKNSWRHRRQRFGYRGRACSNLLDHFFKPDSERAGAQRIRSEALLTGPQSGQPPATVLDWLVVEQICDRPVEQAHQTKVAGVVDPQRA